MMDMHTGKAISLEDHIKQSIYTILLTPKGSRVLNREFGSNLHQYLDMPINAVGALLGSEIINSISQGETRIKINKVKVSKAASNGSFDLQITYNNNQTTNLTLNN